MKIGILTYHRSVNHGAFLQTYCLTKSMQKFFGKVGKVEVIDYTSKKAYQLDLRVALRGGTIRNIFQQLLRWYKFQQSVKSLPLSKDKLKSDNLRQIEIFLKRQNYDVIIVGSDEVWKTTSVRGFPNAYWLNFQMDNTLKVTYAVSSRSKLNSMSKKNREYARTAIMQFELLGIRDDVTGKEVYDLTHKNYIMCCDPTFMVELPVDKGKCREQLRKKIGIPEGKLLMGVMLAQEEIVEELRKQYGNQYYIISLFEQLKAADINYVAISPFEFVRIIASLDCFVTTRFHGAVFAIKEKIPFVAIDDYDSYERSRLRFLLEENQLGNHLLIYSKHKNFANTVCQKLKECMDEKEYSYLATEAIKKEKSKFIKYMQQFNKIMREYYVSENRK